MSQIITVYKQDGTVVRFPIGYTQGACNDATAPYRFGDNEHGASVDVVQTDAECENTKEHVKQR